MAIPHADDVAGFTALRPNKDHEPAIEPARRDVPRLAVRQTRILARCHPAGKNPRRIGEIESSLGERPIPLRRVEGDFQDIICNAK